LTRQLSQALRESTAGVELEVLLWPGRSSFSTAGNATCRVVVSWQDEEIPAAVERSAHAVLRLNVHQGTPAILDALNRLLRGQQSTPTPSRLVA
jgi:hypothetical protein